MLLRHVRGPLKITFLRPALLRISPDPRSFPTARFYLHAATSSSEHAHSSRNLQSSSNLVVVAIAAAVVLAGGSYYILEQGSGTRIIHPSVALDGPGEPENLLEMPGAILPGRPGNLTPEQEVKLKELWSVVLRVFGVGVSSSDNLEEAEGHSQTDSTGPEKKKRSRVNLFSKKHKNEGGEGAGTDSSTGSNDKWGQTKEFQQVLANEPPEELRKAYWSMVKGDHPDGLLLRFLRARKWDVHNALVMMIATMHWRLQEMHVDDDIMKRGEGGALEDTQSSNASVRKEGLDFLAQERLGKSFLHGTDRDGRPLCFVRVRLHKQGEQSEKSVERYTVFVIETARLIVTPPVDTAVSPKSTKEQVSI